MTADIYILAVPISAQQEPAAVRTGDDGGQIFILLSDQNFRAAWAAGQVEVHNQDGSIYPMPTP